MKRSKNYFFYLVFFFIFLNASELPALVRQPPLAIENARLKARIRELEAKLRGTQIPALETEITQLKQEVTRLRTTPGVGPGVGADFFQTHGQLIQNIRNIEARLAKEKQDSVQTGKRLFALMRANTANMKENIRLRKQIDAMKGGGRAPAPTKRAPTKKQAVDEEEDEEFGEEEDWEE